MSPLLHSRGHNVPGYSVMKKEERKYAPLLPCPHLCIQLVLWEQTKHLSLFPPCSSAHMSPYLLFNIESWDTGADAAL